MWMAIWWLTLVAAAATAAPAGQPLSPLDLLELESSISDDPEGPYSPPLQLRSAYNSAEEAPWLYLLDDMPRESYQELLISQGRPRLKRKMPSLSISNPMEVLRQRLIVEVARKQLREASHRQAAANRVFLKSLGK